MSVDPEFTVISTNSNFDALKAIFLILNKAAESTAALVIEIII